MIRRRSVLKALLALPLLGIQSEHVVTKDRQMSVIQSKSQTFLVTSGTSVQNQPLDNFVAQSVTIDNPTGQWFYLPNQQRWIAPYTLGTIIALNSGQEGASSVQSGATLVNIQSQTPSGQVSRPVTGQKATFVYSTDAHPNAAGTALQNGIQLTQVINAQAIVVSGNSPITLTSYTVPDGYIAEITWLFINVQSSTSAALAGVILHVTPNVGGPVYQFMEVTSLASSSGTNLPAIAQSPANITLQAGSVVDVEGFNNDTTRSIQVNVSIILQEIRSN